MFTNYLKIALRNLLKQKSYSAINLIGLSIGLAAFLFITLWIQDELGYDCFHDKAKRIYRAVRADESGEAGYARTAPLMGATLRKSIPEVENAVRIKKAGTTVRLGQNVFQEDLFYFAEPDVFEVFTFPLLRGDERTALNDPYTVVITEKMAGKYFGAENPVGRTLIIGDETEMKITGVMANIPANSHIHLDFLASWATWERFTEPRWLNTWRSGVYYTYVLLTPDAMSDQVEQKFRTLDVHADYGAHNQLFLKLQPLTDIHFHSHLKQELQANGNMLYVYVFSAVAIVVLLIACINFMNLATARSLRRSREVGMRKVLGAHRSQLIGQFLGESLMVSVAALFLAMGLVEVGLPSFNAFAGKFLSLQAVNGLEVTAALTGLVLLVGLLSGSYPAFFLAAFQPVRLLSGALGDRRTKTATALRKGLIVLQFAISITLIIGTIVVYHQLQYVKKQDLGFNEEQIVVLPYAWGGEQPDRYITFKNELLQNAGVLAVTASGDIPGRMMTSMTYQVEGMSEDEYGGITALIVDPDFAETYEIPMVAGRDFSDEMKTDVQNAFIINEAAAREMGFTPEEAVDKRFRMNEDGRIIGVIKDFHFNSLHDKIEPLVMAVWPTWFGHISVRIAPGDMAGTLATIEETWQRFNPNRPFNTYFFDAHFDELYRADERFGEVFLSFTLLAICIACLGLLGLAAYAAEQRTKEMGIRKVLGASVTNVVTLVSGDFVKLVLVANLIAWPVAWYAMHKWLQNFAYRIDISWWVFVLAGGLALLTALLTVSTQAVRAALANPVDSLRYE